MHQAIRGLFDLSGRVALVTGGNSGIGRSLALALGRAGARTLLVARRAEELDAAVREFAADGIEAHALAADLTDRA
ncbi:MAG: SDR family NAD(P)-dependent oxidoreductase, partial [Betaproteobacteria bacterium PRO3]|nr:SDR family NAD(P)-dependent oxidoreductase [Betaproteobacteria bacterium PRO3]